MGEDSEKVKSNKAFGAPNRDGSICMYKWIALLQDYKKIYDFHQGNGRDEKIISL